MEEYKNISPLVPLAPKKKEPMTPQLFENEDAKNALDEIVNLEIEKRENHHALRKVGRTTYSIFNALARPAVIGAALGGLATGTYQGALEGAQQGLIIGAPLTALNSVSNIFKSKKGKNDDYRKNVKSNIWLQENPIKGLTSFSFIASGVYFASSVAVDLVFGTNLSQVAALEIGGIQGVYSFLKSAWSGKKYSQKVEKKMEVVEAEKVINDDFERRLNSSTYNQVST